MCSTKLLHTTLEVSEFSLPRAAPSLSGKREVVKDSSESPENGGLMHLTHSESRSLPLGGNKAWGLSVHRRETADLSL